MTEEESDAKPYVAPDITRRETLATLGTSGAGGALLVGSPGPPDNRGEGEGPPDDRGEGEGPPDDRGEGEGPPDNPGQGN